MPFFKESGSRRSPATRSARMSAMLSVRLEVRTSSRRSAPCAASSRATWHPTKPVAPVTKAFIFFCFFLYPEAKRGIYMATTNSKKKTNTLRSELSLREFLKHLAVLPHKPPPKMKLLRDFAVFSCVLFSSFGRELLIPFFLEAVYAGVPRGV